MIVIKVLVVDDTIFYRKIIGDVLSEIPEVEVVGRAPNGKIALSRIKGLKPDLITLDVEMPIMNGLELLQEINVLNLEIDCVMVSSKTQKDSEITMEALSLGAFDFIPKPDVGSPEENKKQLRDKIRIIISAYKRRKQLRSVLTGRSVVDKSDIRLKKSIDKQKNFFDIKKRTEKSQVVVIGVSTGGPNALIEVLPKLPEKLNVPIFLVQHMPAMFTTSLAKSLNAKCKLKVVEGVNGQKVEPDTVYIAPGGKQMKVAVGAGLEKIIRITDDPPENSCKPAVDYLFRSVARVYGSKVTAIIMTGMGSDGKIGMAVLKSSGAVSIAQNAESCVVYGMPKAVIDADLVDIVSPLKNIHNEILKTI